MNGLACAQHCLDAGYTVMNCGAGLQHRLDAGCMNALACAQRRLDAGEDLPGRAGARRRVAGGGDPPRGVRPGCPGRVQVRRAPRAGSDIRAAARA